MKKSRGWKGDSKRHARAARIGWLKRKRVKTSKNAFARDTDGKISDKLLSDYGKKRLKELQGAKLHFTDKTLTVKGRRLVDEKGKTFSRIDDDRMVNKIIFKVI